MTSLARKEPHAVEPGALIGNAATAVASPLDVAGRAWNRSEHRLGPCTRGVAAKLVPVLAGRLAPVAQVIAGAAPAQFARPELVQLGFGRVTTGSERQHDHQGAHLPAPLHLPKEEPEQTCQPQRDVDQAAHCAEPVSPVHASALRARIGLAGHLRPALFAVDHRHRSSFVVRCRFAVSDYVHTAQNCTRSQWNHWSFS